MENKTKEYKIKLKQNVTGEQVARIIFNGDYKVNSEGWFNGSSPLGNEINPETNQPFYKNGDANPSFGFKLNENWLNAHSFVDENFVNYEKKTIIKLLEPFNLIDKRVKATKQKNDVTKYEAFKTPSKIIKKDITPKQDNKKMFSYMASCDCWRLVQDIDFYETEKEKSKHKLPLIVNGTWIERTSWRNIQEILKNPNQYNQRVSTRLLSFDNSETEFPIVCLDWDNHSEGGEPITELKNLFIPKEYNINGDDIEFFGIELSQSKKGYHIWIKLKTLEAWRKVKDVSNSSTLPYECFTNHKTRKQVLTTAIISREAFIENNLVCEKLEVETEIKGDSTIFPNFNAKEMINKSYDIVGFNQRLGYYCDRNICWFNAEKQGFQVFVYQNGKWIHDEQHSYIKEYMAKVSIKLLEELDYLQDEEEQEALIRFYKQTQKSSFKKDCIEQLTDNTTSLKVDEDIFEINTGVNKVNVLNGTIVLDPINKTFHFKKHSKEDYLTVINKNISYDPSKDCPKWKQFLSEIFLNDFDLIKYYQKALGYALAGTPKERIAIIQNGMGSNGKSVSAEIARFVFGDYAFSANKDMIISNKFRNGSNNTNLYRVLEKNIRLVTMSEIATSDVIDDSMFKNFTGGDDKQTCGTKYKDDIEKKTQATLFMQTNNLPKVKDTSSAIWRRFRIIPHNRTFEADEVNIYLSDELKEEAQGIFNWILEGWLAYVKEGLQETPEMKKELKEYQKDADLLQCWLDEKIIQSKGSKLRVTDAFKSFTDYQKSLGASFEISKRNFASLLEKKGYTKVTYSKSSLNYFKDLEINIDGFDDLQDDEPELKIVENFN